MSKRLITFRGKTLCVKEWAAEIGISWQTLDNRINRDQWEIERALTTPVNINLSTGHSGVKYTKNDFEMELNDLPLQEIPPVLRKLTEDHINKASKGFKLSKYGKFLRRAHPIEFDQEYKKAFEAHQAKVLTVAA